jgi:hypothetical protein
MTWATGMNGARSYGAPRATPKNGNDAPETPEMSPEYLEPAAVYAKSALNTVEDVVAFGTGRGTEELAGSLDNTAIFEIIRDNL